MLYAKERSVSSEDFTGIKSPFLCRDEAACGKKKDDLVQLIQTERKNTQQASCEE